MGDYDGYRCNYFNMQTSGSNNLWLKVRSAKATLGLLQPSDKTASKGHMNAIARHYCPNGNRNAYSCVV